MDRASGAVQLVEECGGACSRWKVVGLGQAMARHPIDFLLPGSEVSRHASLSYAIAARWHGFRWLTLATICLSVLGCASAPRNDVADMLEPSNYRNWKPSMGTLPYAQVHDDQVEIHNVRNCTYLAEDTYVVNFEDRTYRLADVESVDFIVVPFKQVPSLAHTMLSFGFCDGRYLGVSVEVRLEEGESYSPLGGAARQYEIMYVVADERDLIRLRTEQRGDDVFIYRSRATAEQAQALFVDILKRINQLKDQPEFYDTLVNNCTTNIVTHINHLRPGSVNWDLGVLLPGYSDRMAYSLGLLVDYGTFEETKRRAHITQFPDRLVDGRRYSQLIRSKEPTSLASGQTQADTVR
jgi:hypothetical protein